jgi:site-specific DNA-methyltransferase (adenine-specific)
MSALRGVVWQGDNLAGLRSLPDRSVHCVYLDPPFNTGQVWTGAAGSFPDVFRWDDLAQVGLAELRDRGGAVPAALTVLEYVHGRGAWLSYSVFMALRLVELSRVLARHGTCWLHVDPPAAAVLRIVGDAAFGAGSFRGCVAWVRSRGKGSATRRYGQVHDSILVWSGELSAHRRPWTFGDVIDGCPAIPAGSRERIGYPTQKPLALLRRIIAWSTLPGHTVLDPFCGSGTALVAAQELGRGWIGMDASPDAVAAARRRLGSAPLVNL